MCQNGFVNYIATMNSCLNIREYLAFMHKIFNFRFRRSMFWNPSSKCSRTRRQKYILPQIPPLLPHGPYLTSMMAGTFVFPSAPSISLFPRHFHLESRIAWGGDFFSLFSSHFLSLSGVSRWNCSGGDVQRDLREVLPARKWVLMRISGHEIDSFDGCLPSFIDQYRCFHPIRKR